MKILLGYEVETGKPVEMRMHHTAVFGMTNLSGKTTALEAIISRSGLRALAFITKRGERGFHSFNTIQPYYRPRSDWQFVEGLIGAALGGEKIKYEPGMRWAIQKVCKEAKDLGEVSKNAVAALKSGKVGSRKLGGFDIAVFEKLVAYFELILPELEKHEFSHDLILSDGVNVMDLSSMRLETQQIVIASSLQKVYEDFEGIVGILPEAWEMLPQGRNTPVKLVAEQFIRKGAARGNYLMIDSQDIGGIDKTPLRQCDNWLMGRMKEAHEVERIMRQLLGVKIPASEIQTLPVGHFYTAIANDVRKIYVLPAGVPEQLGIEVARGLTEPEDVGRQYLSRVSNGGETEDLVWKEKYEELKSLMQKREEAANRMQEERDGFRGELAKISKEVEDLKADAEWGRKARELFKPTQQIQVGDQQSTLYPANPGTMEVSDPIAMVEVQDFQEPLRVETTSALGQIAKALLEKTIQPNKSYRIKDVREALAAEFGTSWGDDTLKEALIKLTAPPFRLCLHYDDGHSHHSFKFRESAPSRVKAS